MKNNNNNILIKFSSLSTNQGGAWCFPRSGRVDGGVDHANHALALGEPRAAPFRSGWVWAPQSGRGTGERGYRIGDKYVE